MANFMEDLWNSIFTAGPTPPLLIATNATFAALQLLLLGLLIATYSIHFAVLSFLSAGLWWAINWFAVEVQAAAAAQKKLEEEKINKHPKSSESHVLAEADTDAAGDEMDSTEDTETELGSPEILQSTTRPTRAPAALGGSSSVSAGLPSTLSASGQDGEELRKRRSLADSNADLSTDSEWEKVDGSQ